MAKRCCTSALACFAIVFLCAIVTIVWVQFSQGSYDRQQVFIDGNRTAMNLGSLATGTTPTSHAHSGKKEYIERTYLEDLGQQEAVFVKPLKIDPDVENLQTDSNKQTIKHHSGHFRHKTAEIWDPHPKYEIDAFGQKLLLELENNDDFVAPNLHIITHGTDSAHKRPHDPKVSGCFYTGKLRNDANSDITVNLCHGMTGYIRSSTDNFFIEPAENFTSGELGTILHRIKKLPHSTEESNDVLSFDGPFDVVVKNENGSHIIAEDDFPDAEVVTRHSRKKRDTFDDDMLYDAMLHENVSPFESLKPTRQSDWDTTFSKKSNEYFIKVLIVADYSMLKYHRTHEELTRYILILMSHVSLLFKEASIGNAINIAVVQIQILDHHNEELKMALSYEMLYKFCNWKQKFISDKNHDVALLLTRNAICKNLSSCLTLGVAEVDSMCRPSGCAVVRDKGLSTSYIIAHEFGHVLSMVHDDDPKCAKLNSFITDNTIMNRTTTTNTKPFRWSPCSRQMVTDFLDSPKSKCLRYQPSRNEILSNYTQLLPGDSFEVDKQCELEFGPGYSRCIAENEPPCAHLWCNDPDPNKGCRTRYSPWAEGTKCGRYNWCYKRECIAVDRNQFPPIDGGWGEWQAWGECSRTCGGGIQKSVRHCDSPTPENGGHYCTGKSVQYKSCNTEDCEEGTRNFRQLQCAEFNGITKGLPNLTQDVEWVAKFGLGSPDRTEDYCRLYCKPKHSAAYYALKDKVFDGTKCGKSGFDICVNGMCRPGGCDNKLDSSFVLDDCGVCGGDNSRCQEITGTFNKTADQVSYNRVLRIPKGSFNIKVTQHSYGSDENSLALRDGESGQYILNGNQMLNTQEMEVPYGAITIKYSGSNAQTEWVTTRKTEKLEKDLLVEVLSIKNLSPPDITYRYVISKDAAPRYGWHLYKNNWSKCSSICEGTQYRKPICVKLNGGEEVHASYCDSGDVETHTEKRQCNNHCSLTWHITSRSTCSPHCGKGYRQVYHKCMRLFKNKQFNTQEVHNQHCNVLNKPPATESCYTPCNTTRWDYSNWSECSQTCGGGTQRRSAKCVDETNIPIDDFHCSNSEKIVEQICNIEKCPDWTVADTSACSVPCGGGYQNVTSWCVLQGRIYDPLACDQRTKPAATKPCNEHACGRWSATDNFLPCSVTCGEGIEQRRFVCKKFDTEEVLDQEYCRDIRKPRDDGRKCYKECDRMVNNYTPYDKKKYNYNVINENSVYDQYDRYKTFQWIPGEWGTCSHTCGGGKSIQNFICRNELGEENHLMCDLHLKPYNVMRCNDQPCPEWKIGDWSPKCDSSCKRYRQVRCMDDKMVTYEDNHCDIHSKPADSTECALVDCPDAASGISKNYFDTKANQRFRWKVGAWKQCSTNCGKGTRRRVAECEDTLNEIVVVDLLCKHIQKPKISKPCERYQCKYTWVDAPWASCSASCGQGVQTRNVTCHKVHPGGFVDPTPIHETLQKIAHKNYCNLRNKPSSTVNCLLSHCGDEYMWKPDEWTQCSHKCGRKGRQTRILNCINVRNSQKVPRHFCPKSLRPVRKRKCNQFRCLYKSCKEIKHVMRTKDNRDYVIAVQGKPVTVYCYKMDTAEPQEYISLHPDKENYAEVYDRRLLSLDSCPYGGERRDNCQCDQIGPERSGITKFWKVRLNITALQIIGDDFTFSKQIKGMRIPYGTSGDCYSSNGCPQGMFSVDLTHTSFKLARYVRWRHSGPYSTSRINKHSDTLVQGKCGGYCGECMPDLAFGGLKLEIT